MANILAEVMQTRDAVTGDEFLDLLQTVSYKLSQLKTDLVESLQATFVLYEADVDRVTSWYVEILGIQEKVDGLNQKFYQDRKALKSASDDIDCLNKDLKHCDKGIILLRSLTEIVRNIEKAEPANDFYKASHLVKIARQELAQTLKNFSSEEDSAWVSGLRSSLTDLTTDIYEKASKELRALFTFHFGKGMLVIDLTKDLSKLYETLVNVGYQDRFISKLALDIWQELMLKACSLDYSVEVSGIDAREKIVEEDYDTIPVRDRDQDQTDPGNSKKRRRDDGDRRLVGDVVTIKVVNIKGSSSCAGGDVRSVFEGIYNILAVFSDIFQPEVMDRFSETLGPRICEAMVNNKTLNHLVFRAADGDMGRAQENIAVMKEYLNRFSSDLNFVFPETNVFNELEENFNDLFLSQVKEDLLVKIRTLVKGNIHETQESECDAESSMPQDIAALHKNPFMFPKCVVSKCIVEMIDVLRDHLTRYESDKTMCDAAITLYLSLVKVPKHESEAGNLAPFSAVLIHNNSNYLAHHIPIYFPSAEDKVPELRAKGTQAYSFMLRSIRTKLNSMISDAMMAVFNNPDESSDEEISKFLRISSEFVHLHGMFQFVLPDAVLLRTLATLVDHTVNEMCSKVLFWDDISAACANKLASAFTQFAVETSELFKGDSCNPREIDALTSKCVSKWNRFRLLTFILTASMKDIEDKWVGGCGPLSLEFKADELRKLVRALFQNTDRRAAFLSSIK